MTYTLATEVSGRLTLSETARFDAPCSTGGTILVEAIDFVRTRDGLFAEINAWGLRYRKNGAAGSTRGHAQIQPPDFAADAAEDHVYYEVLWAEVPSAVQQVLLTGEVPSPEPTLRERVLTEIAHVRDLAEDIEFGGAQNLADLVEEYLEQEEKA